MAHAQKPDFVVRQNRRVHLNRRGRQFSWLLAAEVCASAVIMLATPSSEVVWRVLPTHSIRQFPLHFPSRASPCAITFQLDSSLCLLLYSPPASLGIHKKPKHLLLINVIITNIHVNIMARRNIFSVWFNNTIYATLTSIIHKWIKTAHQQGDNDRGKLRHVEINLSKCHFAQQKSYTDWPRSGPRSSHWQPGN